MKHLLEKIVRNTLQYPDDEPLPITNILIVLIVVAFALLYFILTH